MAEYIEREALLALFEERHDTAFIQERTRENREHWWGCCTGLNWGLNTVKDAPTADVLPRAEVEKLIDDFQRTIRADAKVGMLAGEILLHISNMLIELKKKYTEGEK